MHHTLLVIEHRRGNTFEKKVRQTKTIPEIRSLHGTIGRLPSYEHGLVYHKCAFVTNFKICCDPLNNHQTANSLEILRRCGEEEKTNYSGSINDFMLLVGYFGGDKSNCGKADEMFTIGEYVTEEDRSFYEENIVKNWNSSSCVDISVSDDKNDGEDDREKSYPEVDPEVHPDRHPGSEQDVVGQDVGQNNSTVTTESEKPDENSGDDSQQPSQDNSQGQ
ncbi:hypothetical protein HELRODRAFT_183351 [Helobdella robusta]|uniref:Uncharacterized protein n=1 Tax=Helobdella robusta TaxID=6412 RepID=T1FJH9_HELRO|nr:hypothetical protein HELRODRAFT_183351 [Helobdella robusta]ESO11246.1 hypothetical protein HELRODRAFT_183351 [Helobdella robusta]